MDAPISRRQDEPEAGRYGQALARIHSLALAGLARANSELTACDAEEDWEGWSLWRGYRKALLEVLAVTDRLALPDPAEGAHADPCPVAAPLPASPQVRPA